MTNPLHDPRRANRSTPSLQAHGHHGSWLGYVIGYGVAILLTVAAFAIAPSKHMAPFSIEAALVVLAIAQMIVHLIFFLHINTAPEQKTNVMAFGATMLIIAIVVIGSLWIMSHLAANMAPMDHLMNMQR
ncbi:cytochrome o ubiquinol oxidase subunit IV [Dyella nitratireducens]|uniref:Cytochrome bo(3) ubiquinol oxidase subunit 4 n=1 Tax=Dyella nitratireducens TaxID=1849580 RepID=A0ABQ1GED0_9GAMM|nr:cytochrome o ubiquinol oxidase subunit IV [Dyella nitratireducens]GGA42088.1 cytochrome o ubiquinol oxidase subunit IV [Dyella nitratireducens]GLQ42051.1 cytochrome o ubiquinol oxidase subunit IV [Dyella nitratireducens]